MATENLIADEYRSLTPLQTRLLTHPRYSENANDVDLHALRAPELAPELHPTAAPLAVGGGRGRSGPGCRGLRWVRHGASGHATAGDVVDSGHDVARRH